MERSVDDNNENDPDRELADMRELHRVSTKLIQENDVNRLYGDILDAAVILLRSDMGSMQLFIPESNELLLLACKGFHPDSAKHWERVTAGGGSTCGRSLAQGGTRIVVNDVEQCDFITGSDDLEFFRLSGIRSVQTTPLISRDGKIVGMISTQWRRVYTPSQHHLAMLDILARQAADLIERSKAEEILRESEERLKSSIDAAAMGTFVWDIEKKALSLDYRMLQMFGIPATAPDLVMAVRSVIHPQDFAHCLRVLYRGSSHDSNRILHEDIRVLLPSRAVRWLAFHARIHFSKHTGKAVRMEGGAIDITTRKALELQKDEFISIASHELKTPVTSIKAYVQLLLGRFESNSSETNFQLIKKLEKKTERLVKLVHQLVATTRILDSHLELDLETADLNDLVSEYIAEAQPLTQTHVLVFDAGDINPVVIDRDRIGHVITNLISNAIKYSPDGGDIKIRSELTTAGQVRLSVADQGIGIPEEQKARVFDRFFKGNAPGMPNFAGMGLGLYNCAAVIRQHGGEIGVESEQGKGSAFYFTIPSARSAKI